MTLPSYTVVPDSLQTCLGGKKVLLSGRSVVLDQVSASGESLVLSFTDDLTQQTGEWKTSRGLKFVFEAGHVSKNLVTVFGHGPGHVLARWEVRREVEAYLADETPTITLLFVVTKSGLGLVVERADLILWEGTAFDFTVEKPESPREVGYNDHSSDHVRIENQAV